MWSAVAHVQCFYIMIVIIYSGVVSYQVMSEAKRLFMFTVVSTSHKHCAASLQIPVIYVTSSYFSLSFATLVNLQSRYSLCSFKLTTCSGPVPISKINSVIGDGINKWHRKLS